MKTFELGEQEARFAELIWQHEPINSTELVKLAADVMKWKKSTTYTMLKRLLDRGIFASENAVVSAIMTRDEFYAVQSRKYVEDTFGGSLPKFLAAFVSNGISDSQADELIRLINSHKEGAKNG